MAPSHQLAMQDLPATELYWAIQWQPDDTEHRKPQFLTPMVTVHIRTPSSDGQPQDFRSLLHLCLKPLQQYLLATRRPACKPRHGLVPAEACVSLYQGEGVGQSGPFALDLRQQMPTSWARMSHQ